MLDFVHPLSTSSPWYSHKYVHSHDVIPIATIVSVTKRTLVPDCGTPVCLGDEVYSALGSCFSGSDSLVNENGLATSCAVERRSESCRMRSIGRNIHTAQKQLSKLIGS